EFTLNSYDDASITRVVKELGIAKGSVYQYFDNKLELFLFLQSECAKTKGVHIGHLKRTDFPDFWSYWTELYNEGLRFDKLHPLMSNFLYSVHQHADAPGYHEIYKKSYKQVIGMMTELIQYEVDHNKFRKDVPVESMAYFLFSLSSQLLDYMEVVYGVNQKKSLLDGKPLFAGKKKEILMKTMNDYISILKPAFEHENNKL